MENNNRATKNKSKANFNKTKTINTSNYNSNLLTSNKISKENIPKNVSNSTSYTTRANKTGSYKPNTLSSNNKLKSNVTGNISRSSVSQTNNTNRSSYNNTNNKNIITKKTVRKKKKNIYFYLDILLILLLIIGGYKIISKHNKNNNFDNSEKNEENNNTNSNNSNNSDSNNNNEIEIENDTTKEKLKKLGNIDKDLDFFKIDYLDRYINYKEKHPELDNETIVVYVNIGLDNEFYTNTKDSPYKYENTVLSNKFYYLGEDYVPKDLTAINKNYSSGDKKMTKEAALAFEEMAKDAKKDGYNIRAVSTYRSYSYQTNLYNNYAKQDGKEKADTYSARAGYSEHQTGLAVDIDNTKSSYTKFGNTREFVWMKENCYKYGFILRYTKENEFITGYINEPWHYRYVGKEIAKYIYEHPMTYEEYYVRFLDK